jgi:argininosuccinate lyase
MINQAKARGVPLDTIAVAELGEQVLTVFDFEKSVARRMSVGGTAPQAVREQLQSARQLLDLTESRLA